MLARLLKPAPTIRFLCRPEDHGVIAEPKPAKSVVPDWFRKLAPIDKASLAPSNSGLTVKRCMPFIDAMMTGWIIPLAAGVRLEIKDNGAVVDAGWEFDRVMVSNHGAHQVAGNPREPRPPCKFHNYWSLRTPPGWSCLFVPPLNRGGQVFECVAGIVDTDTYAAEIHFPFFATAEDGIYTLEKGTPLVQVIPFRRENMAIEADIRAERPTEGETRKQVFRNTLTGDGWYRKYARAGR